MDSAEIPTEAVWKPIDVALRLGVSVATVYTWLRTGELASVVTRKPGSVRTRTMVPESAVREMERVRVIGEASR